MERDQPNQNETVSAPGVLEKYQEAGKICKAVLAEVLPKLQPGASISELCSLGDNLIMEAVAKVYTKKVKEEESDRPREMEKGVGFPTCISVNEICGNYSPCKSDDRKLEAGDVAKVNMGVQIDGYVAQLAHTVVVGEKEVTGKKANVVMGAWTGLQAALRLLKPGNFNHQVTEVIQKAADTYGVVPLEGVLSHEVQRWLIDGNNVILNKETTDQKVSEVEFQVNQIYCIDVYCSSGAGHPRQSELRIDVFKKEAGEMADLKSKNARSFFGEVRQKHQTFNFAMRSFDDEILARAGIQECVKNQIIVPYPVVIEKKDDVVAQFQWTVLISGKRIILLTSHMLEDGVFKPDGSVTDEQLKELLAVDLADLTSAKKKGGKK